MPCDIGKTHKNKLYCTTLKHPTGYNIGIYEDLYARRRYLNFEKIEILVPGYKGIWDLVFGKSRYLYGLYLFCYGVLKKKGISETCLGVAARGKYLWDIGGGTYPIYARGRYLHLPASGNNFLNNPLVTAWDTCFWLERFMCFPGGKKWHFETCLWHTRVLWC